MRSYREALPFRFMTWAGQTVKRAKALDPPATPEEVAFLQDLYDAR